MARTTRWQELLIPIGIIAGVLVILVPLPAAVLDLLLALSLAFSVVLLLTTVYVKTPLELSLFPSLLLAATLGRLVLNIASTRLILTQGASLGVDAAGGVIRNFSEFVTGDRLVVGLVLFAMIFVIQFIVITKGASRISEVAARFALDGLPGRQMAIDADVQAGLIDQSEAQRRRHDVSRQAEFYGAMDGAGKFVRGDAIAGLLITVINIVGGLFVGLTEGGMTLSGAVDVFTRLTIGDGLVTQVPALLVSLAAGLLVTRSGQKSDLPSEFLEQMLAYRRVLWLAAAFLALLGLTRLPKVPLFCLSAGCVALAMRRPGRGSPSGANSSTAATSDASATAPARPETTRPREDRIEDYLAVDPLEVELGMRLIRLADPQRGGDLLRRVTGVRQLVASEIGVVLPKVRIRDNLRLGERHYRLRLAHNPVAQGIIHPDKLLAVDLGQATGKLAGDETHDPATGQPAVWISPVQRERAEALNYAIYEPAAVVAAHLQETVRQHADELLTRDAAKHLIDELRKTAPAVVDELIPNQLRLSEVQQVLQSLLREEVPIRQLGLILETLGDHAPRTKDPTQLAELVRQRLARSLSARYRDRDQRLWVVTLDPVLEDQLLSAWEHIPTDQPPRLPPSVVEGVSTALSDELQKLTRAGRPPVVLVSARIRRPFKQLLATRLPRMVVLSYQEITRDTRVESVGIVTEPTATMFPAGA